MDNRFDIARAFTKGRAGHFNLMALHMIGIGFEGVDLSIMSEHTKRLREPPLRKCIRGITLMINGRA